MLEGTGAQVPLAAGRLVVDVVVEIVGVMMGVVVDVVLGPAVGPPGKHWEYQELTTVQVAPETQLVEPVHPWPPPEKFMRSRLKYASKTPTLSVQRLLGRDIDCQGEKREKAFGQHCEVVGKNASQLALIYRPRGSAGVENDGPGEHPSKSWYNPRPRVWCQMSREGPNAHL